jgi:hypothetical protein
MVKILQYIIKVITMFYKVSKFCSEKRKMFEDEQFSKMTLKY